MPQLSVAGNITLGEAGRRRAAAVEIGGARRGAARRSTNSASRSTRRQRWPRCRATNNRWSGSAGAAPAAACAHPGRADGLAVRARRAGAVRPGAQAQGAGHGDHLHHPPHARDSGAGRSGDSAARRPVRRHRSADTPENRLIELMTGRTLAKIYPQPGGRWAQCGWSSRPEPRA